MSFYAYKNRHGLFYSESLTKGNNHAYFSTTTVAFRYALPSYEAAKALSRHRGYAGSSDPLLLTDVLWCLPK